MISARRAREADLDKAFSEFDAGGNLSVLCRTFQSGSRPVNRARQRVGPASRRDAPPETAVVRPQASALREVKASVEVKAWGKPSMTIELHTWNTPNGRKISVALEEM